MNEEINEIICSSNHPTAGNDKYHDIEELAEHSNPISILHEMIQFMRFSSIGEL